MGKMVRTRTNAGFQRWPSTLFILCLAFLLQVSCSFGQNNNATAPPASSPPPSSRSSPPPPSPSSSPPPPSPSSSPPPPTSSSPPPSSPPPTGTSPPPAGTSPPPTGTPPPPESSNNSPPPPSPPDSSTSPPPPYSSPPPPSPSSSSPSPPPPPSPPNSSDGNNSTDGSTPTTPQSSKKSKSSNAGVIIGVAAAVGVAAVGLCAGICICKKRKAKSRRPQSNPPLIQHSQYDEEKASSEPPSFYETGSLKRSFGTRYPYSAINTATNGFSEILGRGAFGVVYKGKLPDGTDVAVKKLLDRERGLQDFSAEMKTLGRINHANLVALRGFCFDQNQPYVIYEYVANGSLDKWIFQSKKETEEYVMPWRTRVAVLKGTAKGLAYLHEDLQVGQAIIHLDVKSENILLDEHFVPKVADFGLAKLLGSKMSQTLAAGGTMGYMAPEVIYGAASPKMDVYSFGVVLLEVLSGRRVMMPAYPSDSMFLPAWAVRKMLEGRAVDVIDPLLEFGEFDENEAVRLVMAALLCLQRDADDRPGMSEVMRMIDGSIVPLEAPQSLQSFLEMAERLIKKNYEIPITGGRSSTSSTSNLISGSSHSNGQ